MSAPIIDLEAEVLATFTVPPDGRGYFTPRLTHGVHYVVELEGRCVSRFWASINYFEAADAVYLYCAAAAVGTDRRKPCANLRFDSEQAPLPFYEDRECHLYRFSVTGTGEKMGISFLLPGFSTPRGTLTATVYLPTAEDTEILARKQAVCEAAASRPNEELVERAAELTAALDLFPHYESDEFLRNYATKNTAALMKERKEIIEETVRFHADAEFVALLKKTAPGIYGRSRWRAKALALAEQVAVEAPKKARKPRIPQLPATPPPRPRLTPDEYREREIARLDVRVKDALALVEKQQRTRHATEEMLDRLDVDAEDREPYRQIVTRVFEDDGEEVPGALAAKKL